MITLTLPSGHTIRHVVTARQDGDMRDKDVIARYLSVTDIPITSLILCEQTHGNGIANSTMGDRGKTIPDMDGLVFIPPKMFEDIVSLGVIVADCIPILLYSEKTGGIAAVHSGWKGTKGNIVKEAIVRLTEHSDIASLSIFIGPHIRSCCYSVPNARAEEFKNLYGETVVCKKNDQVFLSLENIVRFQLSACQLAEAQIVSTSECTSCLSNKYYSYRKDSDSTFGEQLGIIAVSR